MDQNNEEVIIDNEQNGDTLDTPSGEGNTPEVTPSAPTAPQIDFAALYRESLAERNRLQAEAEALRNARSTPQEEEITDEHLEKYGTTGTIKKIVAQTIRAELQGSLGDIGQISQDYKRGKQFESAEGAFFAQNPHLAPYRDDLSRSVRQTLANAPNIDPQRYMEVAYATIGMYQANAMAQQMQNGGQPAAQPQSNAPARPSAPTPRVGNAPVNNSAPRLNEIERHAMRKAGFDPNKREDYDKFMAIVNNDEGITV